MAMVTFARREATMLPAWRLDSWTFCDQRSAVDPLFRPNINWSIEHITKSDALARFASIALDKASPPATCKHISYTLAALYRRIGQPRDSCH